jgi:cytochrome b561
MSDKSFGPRALIAVATAPVLAGLGLSAGWLVSVKQAALVTLFATPVAAFLVWLLIGGAAATSGPPDGQRVARWTATSRAFHWVMALCILGTTALFYWMSNLDFKNDEAASRVLFRQWLAVHKSLGLTVLFLVGLRAAWNLAVKRPELPATMSERQRRVAHVVHGLIYLLMVAVPVFGWAASMTYGGKTTYFDLFTMPVWLEKNETLVKFFHPGHRYLAWLLLALVGLHVVAALWHHAIKRDATLWRMLPGR